LMISGTCSSNRLKNASSSARSTHVSRSSSSSHPLQCILRHLLYTISLPNVYAIVQIKLHLNRWSCSMWACSTGTNGEKERWQKQEQRDISAAPAISHVH
jgi:hypothetical protein